MRGVSDHFKQTQHGRMRGLIKMRDPFVHAIDCNRVLNKIVCSNAEEIDLVREHVGGNSGTGNFDHRAHLRLFADIDLRRAQLFLALIQDRYCAPQLIDAGDHREHYFHIAERAGAKNGTQLRFENIDVLQAKTDSAPAKKWV